MRMSHLRSIVRKHILAEVHDELALAREAFLAAQAEYRTRRDEINRLQRHELTDDHRDELNSMRANLDALRKDISRAGYKSEREKEEKRLAGMSPEEREAEQQKAAVDIRYGRQPGHRGSLGS